MRLPWGLMAVNRMLLGTLVCFAASTFARGETVQEKLFSLRWFAEPLVPMTAASNETDAGALLDSVSSDESWKTTRNNLEVLRTLAARHAGSSYEVALLTNLGIEEFQHGYFTRALTSWENAWRLGKADTSYFGKAVVDRAFAELTRMHARLGHFKELEILFKEAEGRNFSGTPQEIVEATKGGYWAMLHKPGESFKCGPAAVGKLFACLHPDQGIPAEVFSAQSTQKGISLRDVRDLSQKVELNLQAAKRSPGVPLIVPCVAHWKQEHYGAIVQEKDGRFLLQDTTFGFGGEIWMSREALEEESSGYFLVPAGALPEGWSAVSDETAVTVWGKGNTGTHGPGGCKKENPQVPKPCPPFKMADWTLHVSIASLHVGDIPLFYTPPAGPKVELSVNYNQREDNQPAVPQYSNFGPKWSFDWVHSLTFDSTKAYLNDGTGGYEEFANFNVATQSYAIGPVSSATLTKIATDHYELRESDGGKQVFDVADGSGRLFRSRIIDPQGNELVFAYDANFRLTTVTDEIGQVTTLTHGSNTLANPMFYRVTLATDPFGRTAQFDYNGSAQLIKITDMGGLTSEFTYGAGDFLQTLTTGYGVTTFSWADVGASRWVEVEHPNGDKERVESFQGTAPGVAGSDPVARVPTGMNNVVNQYLEYRNSFYWDRKAYKTGLSYGNARLYHFVHYAGNAKGHQIESMRLPQEGRVWFNYQGQTQGFFYNVGMSNQPTRIGRVLDDGSTQLQRFSYNAQGRTTESVDPLGRATRLTYAANGIDLLQVDRVVENFSLERLLTMTWNANHQPLTVTDAAGQTTTYTYNARGQLLTVTNAKNEVTTFNYNANAYLTSVDGPLPGTADSTGFTYDFHGRVQTVTDSEGYTLTYSYDGLNRLTRVTYPDTTYQELTYTLLDVDTSRDRRGRITDNDYDSLGQLIKTTDPLDRVTRYAWCRCGAMKSLIDALGQETRWEFDVQGRKTAKVYADGSRTTYQYENTTSRLKAITDAKGQAKHFDYYVDDQLRSLHYSDAIIATPAVSYTYDPHRARESTRVDGTGLTRFSYHPITATPAAGAGRLAQIDGPLPNDNIDYAYDELGRVLSRSIGGVPEAVVYDPLGRIMSVTNALGAFTHTYVDATRRPETVTHPNGQSTEYDYFPNYGDKRLMRLWHKKPGGATLSKFDFTYDGEGQIQTWSQQAETSPARVWTYGYDLADQLTSAVATNPVATHGYTIDPAGNRKTETIDGVTQAADFNPLNQLVNLSGDTSPGRTYEWDAEDRLVAVVSGTHRSEFSYDGEHRRVRTVEKENNVVTGDKRFVWCGMKMCEERNASGSAVVKRFLRQGVVDNGTKLFYSRDHLGSIRELCDNAGAVSARYEYDPYGRRTRTAGTLEADFGFTGHYLHQPSSLHLAPYRAYDSRTARWLSRDWLEERAGPNIYAYVSNDPVGKYDPLGLKSHYTSGDGWNASSANGFGNLLDPNFWEQYGYKSDMTADKYYQELVKWQKLRDEITKEASRMNRCADEAFQKEVQRRLKEIDQRMNTLRDRLQVYVEQIEQREKWHDEYWRED
jgi:RHS repeat-associated protein